MRRLGSLSVLALLWLAACAHQSDVSKTDTAEDTGPRAEIASLEKKIAERKAELPRLRSGLGSASADTAAAPMSSGDGLPATSKCDGVCQAAQEICTCHRRICKLAGEINDSASEDSCRHAQRECEEASQQCASCR